MEPAKINVEETDSSDFQFWNESGFSKENEDGNLFLIESIKIY